MEYTVVNRWALLPLVKWYGKTDGAMVYAAALPVLLLFPLFMMLAFLEALVKMLVKDWMEKHAGVEFDLDDAPAYGPPDDET